MQVSCSSPPAIQPSVLTPDLPVFLQAIVKELVTSFPNLSRCVTRNREATDTTMESSPYTKASSLENLPVESRSIEVLLIASPLPKRSERNVCRVIVPVDGWQQHKPAATSDRSAIPEKRRLIALGLNACPDPLCPDRNCEGAGRAVRDIEIPVDLLCPSRAAVNPDRVKCWWPSRWSFRRVRRHWTNDLARGRVARKWGLGVGVDADVPLCGDQRGAVARLEPEDHFPACAAVRMADRGRGCGLNGHSEVRFGQAGGTEAGQKEVPPNVEGGGDQWGHAPKDVCRRRRMVVTIVRTASGKRHRWSSEPQTGDADNRGRQLPNHQFATCSGSRTCHER